MGLAIFGVAVYHVPFIIHDPWLSLFHDVLYGGVDLFLFFSGMGACHSIAAHGGKGYLLKRVRRILPGLYPVLIPWSILMVALGLMTKWEFLGSVSLIGWWVGSYNQLNWYFSAVWLFFLLAIPLYALFRRAGHPVLLWLSLAAVTLLLQIPINHGQANMLLSRLLVFLTGMLFGRLEQIGFQKTGWLRAVTIPIMLFGLWSLIPINWGWLGSAYGYTLGLWWLPYALIVPGLVILLSDLAAFLRRYQPVRWAMGLVERLGQASSEILIVHLAVYKVIMGTTRLSNKWWLLVLLCCLAGGVGYRSLVDWCGRQWGRRKKLT